MHSKFRHAAGLSARLFSCPLQRLPRPLLIPALLTLLLYCAIPTIARAQVAPAKLSGGVGLGWLQPVGDLGDIINAAFTVNGSLKYQTDSNLGLGIDVGYYDETFEPSDRGGSSFFGEFRTLAITGQTSWLFSPAETWTPFLDAGAGLHVGFKNLGDDFESETRGRFGINFGGGAEFAFGRSSTIACGARYTVIFDSAEGNGWSYGPSQHLTLTVIWLFGRS